MNPNFSFYRDIRFFDYRKTTQAGRDLWFRPSEFDLDELEGDAGFYIAQLWHGDDDNYHIAGNQEVYKSLEAAQKALDKLIVDEGGIIVSDKLLVML